MCLGFVVWCGVVRVLLKQGGPMLNTNNTRKARYQHTTRSPRQYAPQARLSGRCASVLVKGGKPIIRYYFREAN